MAAPILWALAIFRFFLQENLHARKIRVLGGGFGAWGGGGALPILLLWTHGFF